MKTPLISNHLLAGNNSLEGWGQLLIISLRYQMQLKLLLILIAYMVFIRKKEKMTKKMLTRKARILMNQVEIQVILKIV